MALKKHFYWPKPTWRRLILNLGATVASFTILATVYYLAIFSSYELASDEVVQILSRCGNCPRVIKAQPNTKRLQQANTTCELDTFIRGPHQKVVAFSFFEAPKKYENRQYFQGIKENLKLIKNFYPGFTMRVYHELKSDSPVLASLCTLACKEPQLDLCSTLENPRFLDASSIHPWTWRYLASIDHQVDLFLSRDLDSRINQREVAATKEFFNDNKALVHVMRDNVAHTAVMLAGMWAVKSNFLRPQLEWAFKKFLKGDMAYGKRGNKGLDQSALARYIWPWARKVSMSHDSYLCKKYTRTRPFPTRRREGVGNFVGSVISLNNSIPLDDKHVCPIQCRPKNHRDWLYC